jgi:hypothetical protein
MTQMIGETSIEALPAAERSAAKRKPKFDVFHALSCFTNGGFAFSLEGSGNEGFGNRKDG